MGGTLALGGGTLSLSGCGRPVSEISASAARNSNRIHFVQSVGWLTRSESDLSCIAIAFTPFLLDETLKQEIVRNDGVYPVVTRKDPILEMRIEFEKPDTAAAFSTSTFRALQLTFWNFDDPPPVIRIEKTDWSASTPDIELINIGGDATRNGYILGTIRGKALHKTDASNREDAYLWNLELTTSLA